jgi:hypothetical protein
MASPSLVDFRVQLGITVNSGFPVGGIGGKLPAFRQAALQTGEPVPQVLQITLEGAHVTGSFLQGLGKLLTVISAEKVQGHALPL